MREEYLDWSQSKVFLVFFVNVYCIWLRTVCWTNDVMRLDKNDKNLSERQQLAETSAGAEVTVTNDARQTRPIYKRPLDGPRYWIFAGLKNYIQESLDGLLPNMPVAAECFMAPTVYLGPAYTVRIDAMC